MHITDYMDFVGNLAVITTILQFLSGIIVCKQYVVNRTTAETTPLPFIFGVISCALWLLYGISKKDDKIVVVNAIGVTLMIAYTIVFYIYTFKKWSLLKQVSLMLGFLLLLVIYISFEEDEKLLLAHLGLLASFLTVLTIAAPMSKLFYVIKVKSTECLPFPMILMSFVVSALWFLYGLMKDDVYLLWVNFIGTVLAVSQLSLFVIYPSTPQSPILSTRNIKYDNLSLI